MLESINILAVLKGHLRGFQNPTTGKIRRPDVVLHYAVPLCIGVLWSLFGRPVHSLGNLIGGLAILTGLFFGLLVFVFELRLQLDERVQHQRSTRLVGLIDVLFSNSAYATLASGLTAVVTVVVDLLWGGTGAEPFPSLAVAIVLALGAHLTLTGALLVRHAYAAYTELVEDRRRARAAKL